MQFPDLSSRLADVRDRIAAARTRGGHGQDVRIVAVTKTHGPDAVLEAQAAGVADIGENKVQEALGKQEAIAARAAVTGGIPAVAPNGGPQQPASTLRWHLIGHLQRNKVKFLDRFSVFHAVDSCRLADAIVEQGQRQGRTFDVLVEVNVSGEDSKGGYGAGDVAAEADRLMALSQVPVGSGLTGGLRVVGVMTMAPFDAPEAELRRVFAGAREARDVLRAAGHPAHELSMGMSGDYEIAVEEGATMVRLGTVLFGERQ
ncbi:MAG: YggS family pyridoxal phosphate enzyme [Gemmatimonadota bacterium]|nr:YggS family pyridoxal phosphate enzyme [Gemmatimonadota bacterium]